MAITVKVIETYETTYTYPDLDDEREAVIRAAHEVEDTDYYGTEIRTYPFGTKLIFSTADDELVGEFRRIRATAGGTP